MIPEIQVGAEVQWVSDPNLVVLVDEICEFLAGIQ